MRTDTVLEPRNQDRRKEDVQEDQGRMRVEEDCRALARILVRLYTEKNSQDE